jgi:hypothetical protein
MGRIALLSHAVIVLCRVVSLVVKLSYDGLWSSILCDASGPVVDTCGGLSKGMIPGGEVATFMVCGRFLLESTKDRFLGVDPPGQHVSPRVWYGTACLLIRGASRRCLARWRKEWYFVYLRSTWQTRVFRELGIA